MKRGYKILIGIVILLIVIRLILPYVVLYYANKRLAEIDGYYGHMDKIELSLYRGAYIIDDIYINKVDSASKTQSEFFKSHSIDLSVEWKALFHRRIVGKLVFNSPVLIFKVNKTEFTDVQKDTADFTSLLKDFMPLKVNRFEIFNGTIHYIDNTTTPKVDMSLKHTHMLGFNLSNVENKDDILPSTLTAEASAYEGNAKFNMKLDPVAYHATFDLNAEMKNMNLVLVNDFFRAYGKFDVNRGRMGLYMEMAAKEGKFKGYVKPIIKDLDVVGPKDKHDLLFHKIWEEIVGAAGVILTNQNKHQLATKIPMEGNFKDPKINTLDAIKEILKNAFIQALVPSIDNSIDINSVDSVEEPKKGIFRKIFSSKKKDKNDQ